jgi:hypothetical protein
MAKKKRQTVVRALPPATAGPAIVRHKPQTETVVIHTTRERKRNAGGGLADKGGALVPILGGVAGGVATVYGAEKFGLSPVAAAGVGVAAGLGLGSATKTPWMKQALMGVAIGAGTLGGLQLIASAKSHAVAAPKPANTNNKRQAEGDGYVTRQELNDALSKLADSHKADLKEQQKQQTCDLLTALRDEIKKVVAETQKPQATTSAGIPRIYPLYPVRGAADDDYTRNAYAVDDERNAMLDDEYTRNAYGDEERNAFAYDEYSRNAYGDEERNAYADEERNAVGDEERNAYGDEERNAFVEEERNAGDDLAAAA